MARTPIDFGDAAPPAMVRLIEQFRGTVDPERRLLMIKFFARSVALDGDGQEQLLGSLIDTTVTCYFLARYPEGKPES